MAAIASNIRQRDLTRQETVVVNIENPPLDRLAWQVGFALVRLGMRIMGFAGVALESEND